MTNKLIMQTCSGDVGFCLACEYLQYPQFITRAGLTGLGGRIHNLSSCVILGEVCEHIQRREDMVISGFNLLLVSNRS